MPIRSAWTRQQLLVAFALYCRIPFARLHWRNPDIVRFASAIGRTPAALAMKLGNIASLDPAITSSGRSGLSNASRNDRAMWDEMQGDWEHFAVESQQAVSSLWESKEQAMEPGQDNGEFPVGEDRMVSAKARVGQRFFRAAVLSAYDQKCCITGLSIPSLLVASHIIPWRLDRSNRANPRNGLLLSALHDRAFDTGLFTIRDDMTVRVSNAIEWSGDSYYSEAVGRFDGRRISLPEKFAPNPDFLAFHRGHVFQD